MAISTSPAVGARGRIIIGEQLQYEVPVRPTHILDFNSESIAATENMLQSEAIRFSRGINKLAKGSTDITGDINFELSASGYGVLLKHALGDYVKLETVDGGLHARVAVDAAQVIDAGDSSIDGTDIWLLADETDITIPNTAGGGLAVVYRDTTANKTLLASDNAGAGFGFQHMNPYGFSFATAVVDPDNTYTGYVAASVVSVVIAPVADGAGNPVNVIASTGAGIIEYGSARRSVRYFEAIPLLQAVTNIPIGTRIFLDPSQAIVGDAATYPAIGDVIVVKATVAGVATLAPLRRGAFVYHFHPVAYTSPQGTAWTHHLERGRFLPTSGLTVEVDRDAVVFLYSGIKVNTLTLNFETSAIVNGSFSVVGKEEFAIAPLSNDVIPGATELFIPDYWHHSFPAAGGIISIGERTGITYTTKTVNSSNSGLTRLSGIPASGLASIDRTHQRGSNVDSRTSIRAATVYESNQDPLTAFEINVFIDGAYEEVLAASLTLNNNLNTDKFGLGSYTRLQSVEQRATVEGSMTLEFDDGKNYNKFRQATYFSIKFKCVSSAETSEIGSTSVLSQNYYFCPRARYSGTTPAIEGDSYITHEMPFMAIVDEALDTTDLVVILVNDAEFDAESA